MMDEFYSYAMTEDKMSFICVDGESVKILHQSSLIKIHIFSVA